MRLQKRPTTSVARALANTVGVQDPRNSESSDAMPEILARRGSAYAPRGRDDRGDLTQRSTSQPMSTHGEPPPFIIGELQAPPTELTSKDSILFDQVRDCILLLAIEPVD
jgi:hypothetical protein